MDFDAIRKKRRLYAVVASLGRGGGVADPSAGTLYYSDAAAEFNAAPWSKNGLTITSAGVVGPDGTGDASTFTTTAGAYTQIFLAATTLSRMRARVKAGTATFIYFYENSPGEAGTWFNIQTGTLLTNNLNGSITALGGGWFQVEVVSTLGGAPGFGICSGDAIYGSTVGETLTVFDVAAFA
jgi:hypothetical protein